MLNYPANFPNKQNVWKYIMQINYLAANGDGCSTHPLCVVAGEPLAWSAARASRAPPAHEPKTENGLAGAGGSLPISVSGPATGGAPLFAAPPGSLPRPIEVSETPSRNLSDLWVPPFGTPPPTPPQPRQAADLLSRAILAESLAGSLLADLEAAGSLLSRRPGETMLNCVQAHLRGRVPLGPSPTATWPGLVGVVPCQHDRSVCLDPAMHSGATLRCVNCHGVRINKIWHNT